MLQDASTGRGIYAIVGVTALLVVLLVRPHAGGWNDGSRLATVEALVDHGTFAIDASIYVQPHATPTPYTPGDAVLEAHGTLDKLFIHGHYYSDKSPVPAVLMAGVYQLYRTCGGATAAECPRDFARLMIGCFAGLPFVVAVWAFGRTVRHIGLYPPWQLGLTTSFAFGNLALAYTQQVNSHILLLSVAALVGEALLRPGIITTRRAVWLGLLAGFGYTTDLGTGPLLTLSVGGWLWFQAPARFAACSIYTLAALPWLMLHHGLNYAIAGTLGPANAHPEFFLWPGSPFNANNMTGSWTHPNLRVACLYALDMLFGKKGFLLHAPALLLALGGLRYLKGPTRGAIVALMLWACGTWLLYAVTSRNLSGMCLSVRWFVPLLVPGYLTLACVVRTKPVLRLEAIYLLAVGGLLSVGMTIYGPWAGKMPPLYWPLVAVALIGWGGFAWHRTRQGRRAPRFQHGFARPATSAHARGVDPCLRCGLVRSACVIGKFDCY